MITETRLSAALKKRKTALYIFAATAVYFCCFAFLENPLKSTISDIGRTRLPLLAVYCILLPLCDIVNVRYMLRSFKLEAPILEKLFIVSNVCVGFVATTLMPIPGTSVSTFSVLLHWLTGFGNIVLNATVVLLLCLRLSKRENSKKGKILFAVGTGGCIFDLLFFVAMSVIKGGVQEGKNGLYEIIPIVFTHIVLFVINHTNLFSKKSERDAAESAIVPEDKSVFASVSQFFLVAAWLFFTFYSLVRNPIHYTISMTGLDYPLGFGVTCALISVGLMLNFILAFKRSGYKNVLTYIIAIVGSLSLMVCVFAPTTHSGSGNGLDPVHSTAAVAFFILIMAAVFFFFLFKRKENKAYLPLALVMLLMLALTLLVAYIMNILLDQKYGRTGLVEVIPLQYTFILLFIENFTTLLKSEKKEKVASSK